MLSHSMLGIRRAGQKTLMYGHQRHACTAISHQVDIVAVIRSYGAGQRRGAVQGMFHHETFGVLLSRHFGQPPAPVWHTYARIAHREQSLLPDNRHRAKLPENSTNIILSRHKGL